MVNSANRVEGKHLDKHPFSSDGKVVLVTAGQTFLAAMAEVGGVISTREGDKRFQAGDYILTDNPPTHAWPLNEQVFKATMYPVSDPPAGALPNVPAPATVSRVKIAAGQTRRQQAAAKKTPKPTKTRVGRKLAVPGEKIEPGVPGHGSGQEFMG